MHCISWFRLYSAAVALISLSERRQTFFFRWPRRSSKIVIFILVLCFSRGIEVTNPQRERNRKDRSARPTLSSPQTVGRLGGAARRPAAMAKFCESAFLLIVNPFRTSRPPLPLSRPASHPRPKWKSFVEPAPTREYLTNESVVGIRQSRTY